MSAADQIDHERAMTPRELGEYMATLGKRIGEDAIRYHCRREGGLLYGKAAQVGRSWSIPYRAAMQFAATWEPYGSMKKPK